MKKRIIPILVLTAALGLSGCMERSAALGGAGGAANNEGVVFPIVDDDGFKHTLFEGDNTVEHGPVGYCGNTQTTISRNTQMGGKPWKKTFMYDDSVALTDLLLYLDYSGGVCECLPEYNVKTEFISEGEVYGVNLTKGFARYDGGQVSLTEEQVKLIRDIIKRHKG